MTYEVSATGRAIIESFEGCRLQAYQCPAGEWTIGYGHTLGVREGDVITQAQADGYFASDIAIFGNEVAGAIGDAPTTPNEFDALVSLAFNIGIAGFRQSTVLRRHLAGDKAGAAQAFGMWSKIKDPATGQLVVSPGLVARRAEEAALYLNAAVTAARAPMPQAVAQPKTSILSSKTVLTGATGVVAGAGAIVDNADAIRSVVDNVTAATTSMSAMKHSLSLILSGTGLSVVFGIIALVCTAAVVGRYALKMHRGEVVSA